MANNNRIAKNTIFLYIRMVLSMIVSLYTVRVVLQALGVEDYGIYSAVGGIVSSLAIFTGSLSIASQRFFSIEIGKGDTKGLNKIFNSSFILYLLVGVLILVITESAGVWFLNNKMVIPSDRMEAAFAVLQCTLFSFFFSIISSPFQAIIIAKEDMKVYAYVGIYDVVLKLFIAYLLQLFNTDKLILYAVLLLISTISVQLFYLVFTIQKYQEIKPRLKWNSQVIMRISGFSGWTVIGCLAFLCNTQGLNLLLNVFFGPIVNAAYNIGNSIKNAVNQLGSNFFVAVRPNIIKEYAANNIGYVQKLFLFSTKVIFCLMFVLLFPIANETRALLSLWLGEVGDYMVAFVRLMLVWALLLNLSDPITAVVQAANKVKEYHLKVDIFTLLSLPLAYAAFKFGATPEWAFIISLLIFSVAHIIRLCILKNIIIISITGYFINIVLRIVIAIFISFLLSYLMKLIVFSGGLLFLFYRIILEVVIAIIVSYVTILNVEERRLCNAMLKNAYNRILKKDSAD